MKGIRGITVGVTFVAGLYFILDFIVPPTLPGATTEGVVLSTSPASFSARSGNSTPITYRLDRTGAEHPQILQAGRDSLGLVKLVPLKLREVAPGSNVTIRTGPYVVKQTEPADPSVVEVADGSKVQILLGQHFVNPVNNEFIDRPHAGDSVTVDQTDTRITAVDNGAVLLSHYGRQQTERLGSRSVILKVARNGPGTEVQLDELRTGDTVKIGPGTLFADNRDTAAQFNSVLTTMAFGIGLLSLGKVHSNTLIKRKPGWYLSIFFFAAVILGAAAGIGKYNDIGTSSRTFSDFIVLRIISSVTSTVFSLLAFYMASAAYRAFRIKTGEAALMMTSALIVMIGQTPFGSYLTSWMGERYSALWLPNIAAWILRVPNTAVFRALIFGIMLGAIATALRYWLGMEKAVNSGD